MADCYWHFSFHPQTLVFFYAIRTILFLLIFPLAIAQDVSFDYPGFSNDDLKQLKLEGDASISDSAIHLTTGRVTITQPIHLWNKTSNELKDFTAHFSFVVFSDQGYYGDGFTFFLAGQGVSEAGIEGGGGICIGRVDYQTILQTEYQFVAVEFDTYSNVWDPRGIHVGVNVNSMQSDILEQWWTEIYVWNVYDCSIQYNAADNFLNVSFTGYRLNEGRVTQYLTHHIDLRDHLPDYVLVGVSAATGNFSEQHTLLSWSFSTSLPSNAVDTKKKTKLLEGIGIGAGFSVSVIVLVYVFLWRKSKGKEEEFASEASSDLNMDDEFQMNTGPKKIWYDELVSATNNFEEKQKLGQGAFGCVYKGFLKDSNTYVAIKRISAKSTQGVKEYIAEVKIISQLRHKNLVKLTGWCHKRKDLLLIYEYMPNGSLDSRLFDEQSFLSWEVRHNIALGLASALLYLQEEWEKCVIHRDIKSSNIMLDSNFNAKLGDFGLALLVDHEKGSQTTVLAGTMGYLAPEYMKTGKARKESDIFSLGVVLLEIASGRKAIHNQNKEGLVPLVEWVWELYGFGDLLEAADPKLCGVFNVHQMFGLLVVGLWCANPDCSSRPSMRQVIKVLNLEAPLPILPQQIPETVLNLPPATDELFFTVSSF
ncbi:L-type lectin-domain containing receptor kinase IX.1-like [Lotus japonicus]|uniref:L-type lectin-domain containing receptor kinase IX.1-like n=1 Tax=Lotus japonicus TaxID=34305 RepID=UPI00258BB018|nr:L-type lectin-domain containing receptor kinase IX.1-like [Lotus japonicus]